MRTPILTLFVILAAAAGNLFAQGSWLDRELKNWNSVSGAVPKAPANRDAIAARCRSQISRQPVSMAERAVTRAGWSLFGPVQSFGGMTLVSGLAGTDGRCRPLDFNVFVFVSGRFVGTLSPDSMDSRTDGALRKANFEGSAKITVDKSDLDGSTSFIIKTVENSPAGSKWAIGTEVNLVNRLQARFRDKEIRLLAPDLCMCATMYRIAPQNLAWAMANLVDGNVVNEIVVDDETKHFANVALQRMIDFTERKN